MHICKIQVLHHHPPSPMPFTILESLTVSYDIHVIAIAILLYLNLDMYGQMEDKEDT